ncbi:MAG: VWA domain-containing protein [Rikenellaceae bacterium]|nr:VWA domain-containing protein [Rikenellaceae bacterium]
MKGYDTLITRKNPSLFMFMLDCSASMSERIVYNGVMMSKMEALGRIINTSLEEIKSRCRREDGYYDYFGLSVLGYGNDNVESLFDRLFPGKSIVSINDIAHTDVPKVTYETIRLYQGRTISSHVTVPELICPFSCGNTPMGIALAEAYDTVEEWIAAHPDSFPPVIFNITDGECTDVPDTILLSVSERIKSLATSAGNVLLFNVHLSTDDSGRGIIFPYSKEKLAADDRTAALLFDMSSDLPESFVPAESDRRAKAMSYNSSMSELVKMINIGSVSVNNIL